MGIDAARQRQAGGHQEGRPVDRMEAHDVLADDMQVGGPVGRALALLRKAGGGQVVGQGVDPHIHDVLLVAGHGNAPVEGRPRDRQVAQARAHEGHHLVAPLGRADEVGIVLVERQQPVLELRQLEEIAFLGHPFDGRALRAVALAVLAQFGLVLAVIGFVADRVPARIGVLVDVSGGGHLGPDRLAGGHVPVFAGADEIVVGAAQKGRHRLELGRVPPGELGRADALLARALQHLDAVLVGARQEEHVVAVQPLEARQRVGRDELVGVADMRTTVRIGDRGGQVEAFGHGAVVKLRYDRRRDPCDIVHWRRRLNRSASETCRNGVQAALAAPRQR